MALMESATSAQFASWTFKVPAYGGFAYTFNCFLFGVGLMKEFWVPMLGTPVEKLPIVKDAICETLFLGYSLYNFCVGALLYPQASLDVSFVKYQQLVGVLVWWGFLPVMVLLLKAGMMGLQGVVMYLGMNGTLGAFALYNYTQLKAKLS